MGPRTATCTCVLGPSLAGDAGDWPLGPCSVSSPVGAPADAWGRAPRRVPVSWKAGAPRARKEEQGRCLVLWARTAPCQREGGAGPLKDNEAEEVGNPDETPALSPEGGSEDAPADKSHLMGECPPLQGQRAGALGPPPLPSAAATQSLSSSLLSPWPQACSLADAEDILGRWSPGMKWSCSTKGRIDGATGLCHQHIHMSPSNRQRLPP